MWPRFALVNRFWATRAWAVLLRVTGAVGMVGSAHTGKWQMREPPGRTSAARCFRKLLKPAKQQQQEGRCKGACQLVLLM
jgi:hypothetical protein